MSDKLEIDIGEIADFVACKEGLNVGGYVSLGDVYEDLYMSSYNSEIMQNISNAVYAELQARVKEGKYDRKPEGKTE